MHIINTNGGYSIVSSIIRLIIGCIFLGCSIIVIRKSKVIHKHMLYVVFMSISIVLIAILSMIPFENLFITFNSPEAAYEYFSFGQSNIELVVEGNNCDFIIDRKNDSDTYLMIPKTADGWKIGIGSNTKRVGQKLSNGVSVYVYQYKNTSDYFVTILDTNGGESNISDDYNTVFYSLERYNVSLEKNFVTYYAHIPNFNSQYSIIVNGDKIELKNE